MEVGSIVAAVFSSIVIGFALWVIHKVSNI
jgi:hypothetical protein